MKLEADDQINLISDVTKYQYGALWFLVFQHNSDKKGLFKDVNPSFNLEKDRFSLLNQINDKLKMEGAFEFLYESPSENVYLRWRQNQNPMDIDEKTDHVEGIYIFPESTMNTSAPECAFGGLAKSNSNYSLLDGCRSDIYWFYSVGTFKSISQDHNLLPAASWTSEVRLWVRIPMVPILTKGCRIGLLLSLSVLHAVIYLQANR